MFHQNVNSNLLDLLNLEDGGIKSLRNTVTSTKLHNLIH
jgi:hypothetical protein